MQITPGKSDVEVEVKNGLDFMKTIKDGKTPEEAAGSIGMPLAKAMRSPEVIKRLHQLQDFYFQKAEERKALLIATMTEVLLKGEDRDKTAAARVLALDPDLGFSNQGTTVSIQLSEEVAKLDPGTPWEETKNG